MPAATILPSGSSAAPTACDQWRAGSPKLVITLPLSPKVASSVPSTSYRARANQESVSPKSAGSDRLQDEAPTATIFPSLWTTTEFAAS